MSKTEPRAPASPQEEKLKFTVKGMQEASPSKHLCPATELCTPQVPSQDTTDRPLDHSLRSGVWTLLPQGSMSPSVLPLQPTSREASLGPRGAAGRGRWHQYPEHGHLAVSDARSGRDAHGRKEKPPPSHMGMAHRSLEAAPRWCWISEGTAPSSAENRDGPPFPPQPGWIAAKL